MIVRVKAVVNGKVVHMFKFGESSVFTGRITKHKRSFYEPRITWVKRVKCFEGGKRKKKANWRISQDVRKWTKEKRGINDESSDGKYRE